jgi:hypothetical protein
MILKYKTDCFAAKILEFEGFGFEINSNMFDDIFSRCHSITAYCQKYFNMCIT